MPDRCYRWSPTRRPAPFPGLPARREQRARRRCAGKKGGQYASEFSPYGLRGCLICHRRKSTFLSANEKGRHLAATPFSYACCLTVRSTAGTSEERGVGKE